MLSLEVFHFPVKEVNMLHPDMIYGDGDRFLLTFRYVATVEILLVLMSEVGSKCIPKQLPMSDKVSTVKFLFPESHSDISDSFFPISLAKAF